MALALASLVRFIVQIINSSTTTIFLSVGTVHMVAEKGGLYVVYVGAFLVAALLLLRSLYYCVMKISLIEGPI